MSKKARNWLERAIDRRTVLKGMGAATALGGVNVASLVKAQADPGEPNYQTFSKMSTSHWCSFTGHVKGGRLTHVTPLDFDPEPTPTVEQVFVGGESVARLEPTDTPEAEPPAATQEYTPSLSSYPSPSAFHRRR